MLAHHVAFYRASSLAHNYLYIPVEDAFGEIGFPFPFHLYVLEVILMKMFPLPCPMIMLPTSLQ